VEYKVVVKKLFAKQLLNVLYYLDKEWGKRVADDFQDKINAAIKILKQHPYTGAPSKKIPDARGLLITKHTRLFYKIENKTIVIVFLADTRKNSYKA